MQIRSAIALGVAQLLGTIALAQDDTKIQVTADYSDVRANRQNNKVIPAFWLNGGGGYPRGM
jgi:hypothetical protein